MRCPLEREETQDVLLDYSAGRLDPVRAATLESHMQKCAACNSFRMEQGVVWDALDVWEPAPVSVDFNRRLWQRIDAAASAPWYRTLVDSLRFGGWKPAVPVALAVLAIAGGFMLDHPSGSTSSSPAVQRVSFTEADQLEQTLDDMQLLRQLDSATSAGDSQKRM